MAAKKDKNKIISPFHSKVVEVLIHQGDIVEENQPLIRLESMKVISTFTAPYQSRIADVFTSEGQSVETGSILIYLEPITAIQ
ncbi:acetyl-CoA carboxylase biotin carboxyl carrier protein subunit [Klebsiella variicola subsp. variicola]|nr:acetyl-CoA carboxylase biotin carboxyl carrier protein subunit [Klebsiella variicola subsp. variicola]